MFPSGLPSGMSSYASLCTGETATKKNAYRSLVLIGLILYTCSPLLNNANFQNWQEHSSFIFLASLTLHKMYHLFSSFHRRSIEPLPSCFRGHCVLPVLPLNWIFSNGGNQCLQEFVFSTETVGPISPHQAVSNF